VWGGHRWTEWLSLDEWRHAPDGLGLYRIRGSAEGLVDIGQGSIRARLDTHRRKTLDPASARAQRQVLRQQGPLEFSAVTGSWEHHQRLELETDLIAAHILELGIVLPAQFIG
jgi:hypothetical protein